MTNEARRVRENLTHTMLDLQDAADDTQDAETRTLLTQAANALDAVLYPPRTVTAADLAALRADLTGVPAPRPARAGA